MTAYAIFGPGQLKKPAAEKQPYHNRENVYRRLNSIPDIGFLLLGGGKGVDRLAEDWAKEKQVPYKIYGPIYDDHDTVGTAGIFLLRDTEMLGATESVIVFTNPGLSGHTRIISDAVLLRKPVMVFSL